VERSHADVSSQGTSDVVYSVKNAQEAIKLFVNSPDASLSIVEGGQHFLSATHPEQVDKEVIEFLKKHS
jgi:pimeloyl-ACP methyl ester carboxylesterase